MRMCVLFVCLFVFLFDLKTIMLLKLSHFSMLTKIVLMFFFFFFFMYRYLGATKIKTVWLHPYFLNQYMHVLYA